MSRTLRTLAPALVLGVLLLAGCRSPVESLTGEYEAQRGDQAPARVSLRSDGGGALMVGPQEAPFRWEVNADGHVVLHTRQGGVLTAKSKPGALELDIPGSGRLLFRKKDR